MKNIFVSQLIVTTDNLLWKVITYVAVKYVTQIAKKTPTEYKWNLLLQGTYIKILKITWLPNIHTQKHRKGETKEQMGQIKINTKMVHLNPTISLIKWNVNWINTPIKAEIVRLGKKQLLYTVYRRATLNINIHVES